jgi:hypothetical protein
MKHVSRTIQVTLITLALLALPSTDLTAKQNNAFRENLLRDNPRMDELQNRKLTETVISQLFRSGAFEDLEYIASQFRKRKLKTSSGLDKLEILNYSLSNLFGPNIDRGPWGEKIENLIQEWLKKYPNSTSAHLAYSQVLEARAWNARGEGFAGSVKQENWVPFFEYLEKARQYLLEHESIAKGDPRWDVAFLDFARAQNASKDEFWKISHDALDRNPDFNALYFSTVDRLLPKWGGSADEIEKFANEAVTRTRRKEGHALYARIYWHVAGSQYGEDLFTQSSVRWDEMKRGFDDVVRKYPDTWNIYHFAMFACFAKDQRKTQQLMAKIKNERITEEWTFFESYEKCKTFAAAK